MCTSWQESHLTCRQQWLPIRIQRTSRLVSYMMTHQASNSTLGIMTACSKSKCEQIKQTQTNEYMWTHFQYFTENG